MAAELLVRSMCKMPCILESGIAATFASLGKSGALSIGTCEKFCFHTQACEGWEVTR